MFLVLAQRLLEGKIVLAQNRGSGMLIEVHMCLARGFPRILLMNRLGLHRGSSNPDSEAWGPRLHQPRFVKHWNLVLKPSLFQELRSHLFNNQTGSGPDSWKPSLVG